MEKAAPYSPDQLEHIIDSFRFSGNWDAALKGLERYAQVFDIGAATASKQHWSSDDARCFYWSVMCEAMLEYRGSYQQAMLCIKKAARYNAGYPDWRIFMCRILLENSNPESTTETTAALSGERFESFGEVDPVEVMEETLQSVEQSKSEKLLHSIRCLPHAFQQLLLHVFSIIPSADIVFICQNMFEVMCAHQTDLVCSPKQWAFITSRFILRQISLEGSQHAFLRGTMSDYRFWLISDSVVTRSILNEILGDLAVARADILHTLRELSPSCIGPNSPIIQFSSAADGSENETSSAAAIRNLPGPVRRLLLFSAARLPLLEKIMGLGQESYKSFRHCIGVDSVYRNYFPPLLLLGLHVDAAVVILRFAAGLKQGIGRTTESDQPSVNTAVNHLRESLGTFGDSGAVGSLGDDVNLESALLLLRSCHEAMSANMAVLKAASREDAPTNQFVDIELSWGTSVGHNFVESELSIDFLPQSLARRLPKPLSDPVQLVTVVTPSRVAYLMAGIVTKIFRGTDQSSRIDSLTSTESFELLQWGLSNETTPPLNSIWALACCYLRLPISATVNGTKRSEAEGNDSPEQQYRSAADIAPSPAEDTEDLLSPPRENGDSSARRGGNRQHNRSPHFFGCEEADASLELLDQCIAILLQRGGAEQNVSTSPVASMSDHTISSTVVDDRDGMLKKYTLPETVCGILHGVDYPDLALWFGLGHQPSRHTWLPFSLAADLCLYMLEDGPRALHYAGNGLRCMYAPLPGCEACIQLLCFFGGNVSETTATNGGVTKAAPLPSVLLSPIGHNCGVPLASSAEGYAHSFCFSKSQEDEVVKFLANQFDCANGAGGCGVLKLYYTAVKAHVCWGRNTALLMPERLFHRHVALKGLLLLLVAQNVSIGSNGKVSIQNKIHTSTTNTIISTENVLLEYCAVLGEVGEISRALLIVQSAIEMFGKSGELSHLLAVLLDTASAEALTKHVHQASTMACQRAKLLTKKHGDVWRFLNCQLTMVNILWKSDEREKAVHEIDEILSELHKLTVTGFLLASIVKDTPNVYPVISKQYSRFWRACFIVEVLLTASRLFRSVQNIERAKACLEDAWRLLFAFREVMSSGSGSGSGGGGLLWGTYFEDNKSKGHDYDVSAALGSDSNESAKMASISENGVHVLHSHTYWLDALRSVPTFEGWRLSEASGWNVDSVQRRSCIALVANETAEILKYEAAERAEALCRSLNSGAKRKVPSTTLDVDNILLAEERDALQICALEYVTLALSIDPKNISVLVSAANFEIQLSSEENAALSYTKFPISGTLDNNINERNCIDTNLDMGDSLTNKIHVENDGSSNLVSDVNQLIGGNSRILKAMSLASTALEYDDVNFSAWCVLGEAYEKLGQESQAAECYVRALERGNFNASREFSMALYN